MTLLAVFILFLATVIDDRSHGESSLRDIGGHRDLGVPLPAGDGGHDDFGREGRSRTNCGGHAGDAEQSTNICSGVPTIGFSGLLGPRPWTPAPLRAAIGVELAFRPAYAWCALGCWLLRAR